MTKNEIMQILDRDKEGIKNSFGIDDEEINKIKEFLNNDHKGFRAVIDDMTVSNLSDRGKMVACSIIGYVNGIMKTKIS